MEIKIGLETLRTALRIVAGLAVQWCVYLLCPWCFLLWILFPAAVITKGVCYGEENLLNKDYIVIAECVGYLALIAACLIGGIR